GPMAQAEYRARTTGQLTRPGATPPTDEEEEEVAAVEEQHMKKRNMVVPIVVLLALIPPMFLWTGGYPEHGIVKVVGEANGGVSILIAAFAAGIVGLVMGLQQKLFSFKEAMSLYVSGFRSMTIVFMILTLAWSIGEITSELGTADYLVNFSENMTSPIIIPALLFIFGSIITFKTGTSFVTFAIMIPIAMPLAHTLDMSMTMTLAAVLSGGIFGDHCSHISDTTIPSSAGSGSDHIDHVTTQIPYSVT